MNYYSPHTLEQINTTNPAEWMIATDIQVPVYDQSKFGCFFRNDSWELVSNAKPLQELKQARIDLEEAEYQTAIHLPVSYLNTTFQADPESRKLITDVLVAAGFTMPLGFMWRDATNQAVNVEGALLHGLATAILMRGQPLFWDKTARKDAINACLTAEELELFLNPQVTP